MDGEPYVTYTNCEDTEPHDEHFLDDDGATVCIGRDVPKWDSRKEEIQKALAQTIHNSFYAMEAGEYPTPEQEQEPNAGDMQLAVDILRKFDIKEK